MDLLTLSQIGVGILIIVLILIQERSSGMAGIFGGGDSGGFYQTRRGLEKMIFAATIVFIAIFAALALVNLLL